MFVSLKNIYSSFLLIMIEELNAYNQEKLI